ncbi:MAG: hypothetical protein PW843_06855 [Azospirillaceae bacterium]|nr:hypothetical protein [Azospirillaceae bacterium]
MDITAVEWRGRRDRMGHDAVPGARDADNGHRTHEKATSQILGNAAPVAAATPDRIMFMV